MQAEATWATVSCGILLLKLWVAAKKGKATAAWVTTIMNKNVSGGSKSGNGDCELREETKEAAEQRGA